MRWLSDQVSYWTDTVWHERWFQVALAIAGLAVVGIVIAAALSGAFDAPPEPVDLNAMFSILGGTQLEIDNREPFDWTRVYLTLNNDYKLYLSRVEADTVYTVGLAQFAKEDGTRFNPFATKPLKVTMSCDIPDGKGTHTAYWH